MRRASISIPSNIAEGFGRGSEAQIVHFLDIVQGSAFEIETQVYLSFDQNYFNQNPEQAYCAYVIKPKKDKFEKVFKDRLKH